MNNFWINFSKCNVICFCREENENTLHFQNSLNGKQILQSDIYQELGIIFDGKLSFLPHISRVASLSFKALNFIIHNSNDFRDTSFKLLFNWFFKSKMEYASTLWSTLYAFGKIQIQFLKFLALREDGITISFNNNKNNNV